MRLTLDLDDSLMELAENLTGIHDRSTLIAQALKTLIARKSAERLAHLGGSQPDFEVDPRRRPE